MDNQTISQKIEQCFKDIQKYESWGRQLAGQTLIYMRDSKAPISGLVIHNGLKYFKAKMKLEVLQDISHPDEEKEKRLRQIDLDIHEQEEIVKRDLIYRRLLLP